MKFKVASLAAAVCLAFSSLTAFATSGHGGSVVVITVPGSGNQR